MLNATLLVRVMSITHIQFYPSDWLAGTRGLSAEETGVYITLICHMYDMCGPIERDDDRLHRMCGTTSKKAFQTVLDYLIGEGKITENDGSLCNERVLVEVEKITKVSDKARHAAEVRWKRKSNKNNGTKMHPQLPGICISDANHKPVTSNHKKETPLPPKGEDGLDQEFEEWWADEYPDRASKHSKQKAKKAYLKYRKAGITKEQIWSATLTYFNELAEDGKVGSQYVKMATTFLNDQLWEQ